MIKVPNINGTPKSIPEGDYAVHSDQEFFYFFKNEEERTRFFQEHEII
jgi:hypothetical protein